MKIKQLAYIVGIMAYFVWGLMPGLVAIEKRTKEPRIVLAQMVKR